MNVVYVFACGSQSIFRDLSELTNDGRKRKKNALGKSDKNLFIATVIQAKGMLAAHTSKILLKKTKGKKTHYEFIPLIKIIR